MVLPFVKGVLKLGSPLRQTSTSFLEKPRLETHCEHANSRHSSILVHMDQGGSTSSLERSHPEGRLKEFHGEFSSTDPTLSTRFEEASLLFCFVFLGLPWTLAQNWLEKVKYFQVAPPFLSTARFLPQVLLWVVTARVPNFVGGSGASCNGELNLQIWAACTGAFFQRN